jgi:hypothetical protein
VTNDGQLRALCRNGAALEAAVGLTAAFSGARPDDQFFARTAEIARQALDAHLQGEPTVPAADIAA